MTTTQDVIQQWGQVVQPAVCETCDWTYLLTDTSLTRCPNCYQGTLETFDDDLEQLASIAPPELVMPFSVTPERVQQALETFIKGIPLPPHDLDARDLTQRAQRVYLPRWLLDAKIQARWRAEAGFQYEVESYKQQYRGGQWQSQKVLEKRLDWEPRMGQLQREYDNTPAPALDEDAALERQLGAFMAAAQNYQPNLLTDSSIRLPNRSSEAALREAQETMRRCAAEDCQKATRAEDIRDFKWQASLHDPNWTLLLQPMLTTYYRDDSGVVRQVRINGISGKVFGQRRGSMRRAQRIAMIGVIVALVIMIGSIVSALAVENVRDFSIFIAVVAGAIGIGSLVPLIRVWNFNTQEAKREMGQPM